MSSLIRPIERKAGEGGLTHVFWCPACRCAHGVSVRSPGPVWTICGSDEKPTIIPSVKIEVFADEGRTLISRCHLNVQGGMLHFCPDCTHGMVNRVVPMEEF